MKMRGLFFGGLALLGGIIIGFIFLIRGCLSQYGERSVRGPLLYFNKNGKQIVVALVRFDKTDSYQRSGGFVRKSVTTTYYLQANDPATGEKINETRVAKHSAIRHYPVELIASVNGFAWGFVGKLTKYDPFTLEKVADIKSIEAVNPVLKGKFPEDRQYYKYNDYDSTFLVTMTDGSIQRLNTTTLQMSPVSNDPGTEDETPELTALNNLLKNNREALDSLMEQKLRKPSRLLAAREITVAEYQQIISGFNKERAVLHKHSDSLQELVRAAEKINRKRQDVLRSINNLKGRTSLHFSQVKINADTLGGKWYGLYTDAEFKKLQEHVYLQAAYEDPARRRVYTASYAINKFGDPAINKANATPANNEMYFLNGGFLLDKHTGLPTHIGERADLLIVHKEKIGNEGHIMISRLERSGKLSWTVNTHLPEWGDWIMVDGRLIILGRDNKELSGDEQNLLLCLDLQKGVVSRYDYFGDKLLTIEK